MEIKSNISQEIANTLFDDERLEKLPDLRSLLSGYYSNSDEAHMLNHIDAVKGRAIDMMIFLYQRFNIKTNALIVLIAIELHDVGSCIDREHHDMASLKLIRDTDEIKDFLVNNMKITTDEFMRLTYAVLQHGSHFDGDDYYSVESEVVASADRDNIDIYEILYRSTKYSQKYNPDNVVEATSKYNISRYASPYDSKDYRVPSWHFDYYIQKYGNGIWNSLMKFFNNEKAVYRTVEMINSDCSEYDVRNYIKDTVSPAKTTYSEAVEVKRLFR